MVMQMHQYVWWTSEYFGKTPREVPDYYLRLGMRSGWLFAHDRDLWRAFVAEYERRGC